MVYNVSNKLVSLNAWLSKQTESDSLKIKEILKKEHNIFFMSKSDAVLPVQIIMDRNNKPTIFRIGVEDDGTLFFGNNDDKYFLSTGSIGVLVLNKVVYSLIGGYDKNFFVGYEDVREF